MDTVRNYPVSGFLSGLETQRARKRVLCVILGIFFLFSFPNTDAFAQTATPEAPPGFELVSSGEGVWLFRRDYPNGTPDFVQVVDLSKKAGIMLMYANIIQPRTGRGVYGGDDPRFSLQPLDMFWEEAMMTSSTLSRLERQFSVPETPTRLAFPQRGRDPSRRIGTDIPWSNRCSAVSYVDIRELSGRTCMIDALTSSAG
jgi:hypothetical protein